MTWYRTERQHGAVPNVEVWLRTWILPRGHLRNSTLFYYFQGPVNSLTCHLSSFSLRPRAEKYLRDLHKQRRMLVSHFNQNTALLLHLWSKRKSFIYPGNGFTEHTAAVALIHIWNCQAAAVIREAAWADSFLDLASLTFTTELKKRVYIRAAQKTGQPGSDWFPNLVFCQLGDRWWSS